MRRLLALLAVVSLSFCTLGARAEESTYRTQVAERSATHGMGVPIATDIRRAAPRGADRVLDTLVSEFELESTGVHTDAVREVTSTAGRKVARGEGWFLEVRGDGDWVRYRNVEYVDGPENSPVRIENRPTLAMLGRKGLDFVASRLRAVVDLGTGENLELWYSSHSINIAGEPGGAIVREVIASKVVITRTIGGVPVVGDGSKIAVYVAANGTIFGFDVDWSAFQFGNSALELVAPDVMRNRANAVRAAKGTLTASGAARVECGYYDIGSRDPLAGSAIQPACVFMNVEQDGRFATKWMDVVPVAVQIQSDSSWPETLLLAGG